MFRVIALGLCMWLCGCMISPAAIKSDTLGFGEVIEDTTNKLLVLNVLRARDKAPLHFADIPLMRETLQQSFSFTWLDFFGVSRAPSSTRDSLVAGTSVQKSPSFDLNHLHSKDFITGISSPIDPKVVKYWLDRGLDRRLALLLFFSAVEITETLSEKGPVNTIRLSNSPREAAEVIKARKPGSPGGEALLCDRQSDFERYLKLLNQVRTFFANTYRERRLLAKDLTAGSSADSRNLQAFAALDQSKVQLVYDQARGTYSVYSLGSEQKIAFCFYGEGDRSAAATADAELGVMESGREPAADRRTCFQSTVDVGSEDATRRAVSPSPIFFPGTAQTSEPSRYCSLYNRFAGVTPKPAVMPGGYPKLELRLYIRSVGEIFQFLGDLLHYQEEVKRYVEMNPQIKLNTPVTFGYCGDLPEPGCDDVFLRLDADPCNSRFSLTYRDQEYYVGNFDPPVDSARGLGCRPDPSRRRDHTLEVLAVLHQLIGLNKSAADIRSTPSVNVLP